MLDRAETGELDEVTANAVHPQTSETPMSLCMRLDESGLFLQAILAHPVAFRLFRMESSGEGQDKLLSTLAGKGKLDLWEKVMQRDDVDINSALMQVSYVFSYF